MGAQMRVRDLEPDTIVVATRGAAHLHGSCRSLRNARNPRRKRAREANQDKKVCSRCTGEYDPRQPIGGWGYRPHLILEEMEPGDLGLEGMI